MLHKSRAFCVGLAASPEELAEKLTNHTWTRCTGFELHGYLFLNDSSSEDGPQEYAVLKKSTAPGRPCLQVETIPFGWCDFAKALDYIRRTLVGEYDESGRVVDGLTLHCPQEHGTCPQCA